MGIQASGKVKCEVDSYDLISVVSNCMCVSRIMRKPTLCICDNKEADQLCGNREDGVGLCFRYMDSTIPLLSKSKISHLLPLYVSVQSG